MRRVGRSPIQLQYATRLQTASLCCHSPSSLPYHQGLTEGPSPHPMQAHAFVHCFRDLPMAGLGGTSGGTSGGTNVPLQELQRAVELYMAPGVTIHADGVTQMEVCDCVRHHTFFEFVTGNGCVECHSTGRVADYQKIALF